METMPVRKCFSVGSDAYEGCKEQILDAALPVPAIRVSAHAPAFNRLN